MAEEKVSMQFHLNSVPAHVAFQLILIELRVVELSEYKPGNSAVFPSSFWIVKYKPSAILRDVSGLYPFNL